MRTYQELIKLPTFEERYRYLKLDGWVGIETFGFDRYVNQKFYQSYEWKELRRQVILRDNGCDLGIEDRPIPARILIHHMNPITLKDILQRSDLVMNPDYLITVSHDTHNAIHYGDESLLFPTELVERRPNDTCPWRR